VGEAESASHNCLGFGSVFDKIRDKPSTIKPATPKLKKNSCEVAQLRDLVVNDTDGLIGGLVGTLVGTSGDCNAFNNTNKRLNSIESGIYAYE
jgi:hypothetical protein